jgi:hypothetical protein
MLKPEWLIRNLWMAGLVIFAGWFYSFLREAAPTGAPSAAMALTGIAVLVLVTISLGACELLGKLRLLLQVKRLERRE